MLTQRSGQEGKRTRCGTQLREIVLRADVGNVERAMLAYPANLWLIIIRTCRRVRQRTKMSSRNREVRLLDEPQQHVIDPANRAPRLDDSVEDRLPRQSASG